MNQRRNIAVTGCRTLIIPFVNLPDILMAGITDL